MRCTRASKSIVACALTPPSTPIRFMPGPRDPSAQHTDFAQTFHLPIVYLVGCPGFLIGLSLAGLGHPRGQVPQEVCWHQVPRGSSALDLQPGISIAPSQVERPHECDSCAGVARCEAARLPERNDG